MTHTKGSCAQGYAALSASALRQGLLVWLQQHLEGGLSQCIPRPSLSDLLTAHEEAVTLLVLSPQLKTCPSTWSLWGKPGIRSPQRFVSAVQLHSSSMYRQRLQAPVCLSETLAVLAHRSHRAGWPHRGSRSCKSAVWDVLMYLFCTDLHSWSDQLDLT